MIFPEKVLVIKKIIVPLHPLTSKTPAYKQNGGVAQLVRASDS